MGDNQDPTVPPSSPPPESTEIGPGGPAGFRVAEDGSVWLGSECLEKAPLQQSHPRDEAPLKIGTRELSRSELEQILERDQTLAEREAALEAAENEVLPYSNILGNPNFREVLREAVDNGVLEAPAPPRPEDRAKYDRLRLGDPDFDSIREIMVSYAESLPPGEAVALNTDPRTFIDVYQRIKKELGDTPLPKRHIQKGPIMPSDELRRRLQAKEAAKNLAILQKPGGLADSESSDRASAKKQYRAELAKIRGGDNDALVNLLAKTVFGDRGSDD